VTSTLTVWSERGLVTTLPCRTIDRNDRSWASSQSTCNGLPMPLPGVAIGSLWCWGGGVARVQITIASEVGSPLATP
jgi:hypothetical protein